MAVDREVAGIRCSEVLAKLSAYLDGELAEADVQTIRRHVAACDVCERFGGRFAHAVERLRQEGPPPAVSPEVAERLRKALGL
jgi:anti-sigma factor RsiW